MSEKSRLPIITALKKKNTIWDIERGVQKFSWNVDNFLSRKSRWSIEYLLKIFSNYRDMAGFIAFPCFILKNHIMPIILKLSVYKNTHPNVNMS